MMPGPVPGTVGEVFEWGDHTHFAEAGTGRTWRFVGGGVVPLTPDTAHALAEDTGYPWASTLPLKPMPFVWPGDAPAQETQSAKQETSESFGPIVRRRHIKPVLDCLVTEGLARKLSGGDYASDVTQREFLRRLRDACGVAAGARGFSPQTLRDDFRHLRTQIAWKKRKN